MDNLKLYDAEYKLMTIIWDNEPINSTQLVKLCNDKLGWKKSTTYTVLRKLRDRKLLENQDAIVKSLVKQDDIKKYESEVLLGKAFESSLPKFLAAFLGDRKITAEEAEELKRIIDKSREEI